MASTYFDRNNGKSPRSLLHDVEKSRVQNLLSIALDQSEKSRAYWHEAARALLPKLENLTNAELSSLLAVPYWKEAILEEGEKLPEAVRIRIKEVSENHGRIARILRGILEKIRTAIYGRSDTGSQHNSS